MHAFRVLGSIAVVLAMLAAHPPATLQADETRPRIAVIPVADNSPPGLNAVQYAVGRIEMSLGRLGSLEVLDSPAVAAAVREFETESGGAAVDWRDLAGPLDLDYAALLSVTNAHVEYLGEQFDHLAVGELDTRPGKVHIYEGVATLRLKIVDLRRDATLMDEEATGKKSEGLRQSRDAARYAEIVSAVRDLAAIFDESIQAYGPAQRADEHASLAIEAIKKASKKLERPVRHVLGQ